MATRGRRLKSPQLHLVQGTWRPTRHGDKAAAEAQLEADERCALARPSCLKGEARKAWDRFMAPCWWIDIFREPAAIAFCELWAERSRAPDQFTAARHAQLRAYMQDLGLTDDRRRPAPVPPKDPAADFLRIRRSPWPREAREPV